MLNCKLCPRKCGANRPYERGECGAGPLKIGRAAPHYYEEPPISGKNGSGAVFFSACPLSCVFCQNHELSQGCAGAEISTERLAAIFRRLEDEGCHNINLVSPTPYVPEIIKALDISRPGIPVVYNTSGYERRQTLAALEGYVDVYLPDFKYVSRENAEKYSGVPDYPEAADEALEEMIRQCGGCEYDENGLMKRGVIVRHLVLPGEKDESIRVLEHLKERFGTDRFILSLMSQYVPMYRANEFPKINRKLTSFEYRRVSEFAEKCGFNGFFQDPSSQTSDYTPDFDLTGI